MIILKRIMESIKAKPEAPEDWLVRCGQHEEFTRVTSELIRLRAHELWEENGKPESEEHEQTPQQHHRPHHHQTRPARKHQERHALPHALKGNP